MYIGCVSTDRIAVTREKSQDSVRGPRPCAAPATLRCTRARLLSESDHSTSLFLLFFCAPNRTNENGARKIALFRIRN